MIGSEAARKDRTEHSRLRALAPVMTITGEGLVLGATALAKIGRDRYGMQELSVGGAAERILALLAVAYGMRSAPKSSAMSAGPRTIGGKVRRPLPR
jgi:hypothetical protein